MYTIYSGYGGPYVIVVSYLTVKTYQGSLAFTTTSSGQIYVNPNICHVSSIRERFSALSLKVIPIEGATIARIPPEEAMFISRMVVEALVDAPCAGELKVDVVTLKATIIAINNHYGWYYVSCKSCGRKVVPKDGVYVCNTCAKMVDFPLTLFRVNVQVEDATGSTTVVLYNDAIEHLLDISAKKIINNMPPGDSSLPTELQPLLGREFVFKLKLNKYNLVEGLQDYGVSAVYTPLEELDSVHAGGDLMESQTDDDNVPEGDKKLKRVLSPVIKNVTENSGEGLSAINKDAVENRSRPVINDATGNCSGDP